MYDILKELEQSRASAVQPAEVHIGHPDQWILHQEDKKRELKRQASAWMPRSVSVINYHFNYKMTSLRDVIKSDSPNNFHIDP